MPKGQWLKYSDDDIKNIIKDYQDGDSTQKLGIKYKCDPKRISRLLKKNNIKVDLIRFKFTKNVINEIISKYNDGKTLDELSKEYGVLRQTIGEYVNNFGQGTRDSQYKIGQKRLYKVNENYFENIDTEDKAYWIGFLLTDGCVSRDYRGILSIIGLQIQNGDAKHLDKFVKCLDSNYPVCVNRSNNNSVSVRIFSEKMCKDLSKYGIVERKTYLCKKPDHIPSDLERHFWRGCIDGDGGVYNYTNTKNLVLYGNFELLNSFVDYCKNLGIEKNSIYKDIRTKQTYRFYISDRHELNLILNNLYSNCSIYLDRKYNVSIKLIDELSAVLIRS